MESELPSGWAPCKLGDIIELQYGKALPAKVRDTNGDVAVYGSNGRVGNHSKALVEGPCIIVGRKGTAGAVEFSKGDCWPIDTTYFVRSSESIDIRFLFFRLKSLRLADLDRSTAIPGLNRDDAYALKVGVPPLSEQRRIVEKIETLFTRLDKGEEALRVVQKLLVRYRQSVLKAAVTGQLTADWRAENAHRLEHSRDLLARILQTRRETWQGRGKYKEPAAPDTTGLPELPEGWVWTCVEQLIAGIEAGKNFRCEERPPEGDEVGIVKISAVTWDEFNELESKTVIHSEHVKASYLISEGDLLISRANTLELVGASVVVENVSKQLQLSDKVLRLRCIAPIEYWLNYVLKSPFGRSQIEIMSTGAQMSMRNISQKNLEKIVIPLPSLDELKLLVDEIRLARMQGDHLLKLCQTELARSAALRQSILKDAFAGRLVAQDPADEPAAELLSRIKAAKDGKEVAASAKAIRKAVA